MCRSQHLPTQPFRQRTQNGSERMLRRYWHARHMLRTICAPLSPTIARCSAIRLLCTLAVASAHRRRGICTGMHDDQKKATSTTPLASWLLTLCVPLQALAVDGKQPVAQYGLAQMTLLQGQGEIPNAISLLESSLTAAPAWPDALTVRPLPKGN